MEKESTKTGVVLGIKETMATASISTSTRDLLELKAALFDITSNLVEWLNNHYVLANADDDADEIYDAAIPLHKIIDRYLIQRIEENMLNNDLREIGV